MSRPLPFHPVAGALFLATLVTLALTVAPSPAEANHLNVTCNGAIKNGTAGPDYLAGSNAGRDRLYGYGGDDRLDAFAYMDCLFGGDESDVGFGGKDNDRVVGDAGSDFIYGGDKGDQVWGGPGDDKVYGGADPDELAGGDGNDTCYGQAGADEYAASCEERVEFFTSNRHDSLGSPGPQPCQGTAGGEYGQTTGPDMLFGGAGIDVIYGLAGSTRSAAMPPVTAYGARTAPIGSMVAMVLTMSAPGMSPTSSMAGRTTMC